MGDFNFWMYLISNLGIIAGYLYIGGWILPKFIVSRRIVSLSGASFFVLCALTHLELFIHGALGSPVGRSEIESWHMVLVHSAQVVAVWGFAIGLGREIDEERLLLRSKKYDRI